MTRLPDRKKRTKFVISDVHVGTGHKRGRPNVFDDFVDDDRLVELLVRMGQQYGDHDLELIINGDFFDLLKVPVNGLFPEAITESLAALKVELCLRGHPKLVDGLRNFLRPAGRRITYLPGNHDMDMIFPAAQRVFCRALTGNETDERVQFIVDRDHYRLEGGIEIHHGHQFEAMNSFDWKNLTLERPHDEPILNLPWGSLFILQVLNRYMEERPYLDKVYPFWPVIAGGMLLDTRFTVRLSVTASYYFLRARVHPIWRHRAPFTKLFKFLLNEINLFEKHEKTAQKLFKADPTLRAVIMGHTHIEMLRTFGRGEKVYVNTGTWVPMVSLNVETLGKNSLGHYALIRYRDGNLPQVSLMKWHGRRSVHEEVLF